MRHIPFCFYVTMLLSTASVSCRSGDSEVVAASSNVGVRGDLHGVVSDVSSRAPVANVLVNLNNNAQLVATTTTNANGIFVLNANQYSENMSLALYRDGYTSLSVPFNGNLAISQATVLQVKLKAVEYTQSLILPSSGSAPLVISVNHTVGSSNDANANTSSTLEIAAGDLVDAAGMPVSGNVQVEMSFVGATDSRQGAPSLWANANQTVSYLQSLGMAYMQVTQNGNVLSVDANQSLTWIVSGPADVFGNLLLPYVGKLTENTNTYANDLLYVLNENSGMWQPVALQTTIVQTSNLITLSAQLPHLTHWNYDGLLPMVGACTMGNIVDQCGDPVAYYAGGFFTGSEDVGSQTVEYAPFTTNALGQYCLQVRQEAVSGGALVNPLTPYTLALNYNNPNSVGIDSNSTINPSGITLPCVGIQNQPSCWDTSNWVALEDTGLDASTTHPIYSSISTVNFPCDTGLYANTGNDTLLACYYPNGNISKPALVANTVNCHLCDSTDVFMNAENANNCMTYYHTTPVANGTGCGSIPTMQVYVEGKTCCTAKNQNDSCSSTEDCCNSMLSCKQGICQYNICSN